MDAKIEEEAAKKAETMTAQQVQEYKEKAKKEAEAQAAKDKIENQQKIEEAAEQKAQEAIDEYMKKRTQRAILDLGSSYSQMAPYIGSNTNMGCPKLYECYGVTDRTHMIEDDR